MTLLRQFALRFTQTYCGTSVCAPSRASLMTGLHSGHCPVRGNWEIAPEGQKPLSPKPSPDRRRGKRGGDLKIACIAITHNATFLTRNTVDFALVSGLRFENWLD